MAGDGASIDIGITKAITAPFKILSFMALACFVLLVGRMAIDMWMLSRHPDALPDTNSNVTWELARAESAPDFFGSSHARAVAWADIVTDWLYRKLGLIKPDIGTSRELGVTSSAVQRGIRAMDFAIERALAGSQILAIRAAILVSYLPWVGFVYLLAIIDGLVERARRKFGGGRESSTIYHRAKYFQVTLATLATTAYLWWPSAIDADAVFTLVTLCCALLARQQAKYYKKYL